AHADLTSNVATNSPPAADASASNGTQAGTITQTASVSPAATGPNGSDTFVFAANFGHETIANFHPDTDLIQIDHAVFADFQAILAIKRTTKTLFRHGRVGEGSYFAAPPRSSLLFQCAYTIVRSMTRRSSGR